MKSSLAVLLLLICLHAAHSQSPALDSLEAAFQKTSNDTERLQLISDMTGAAFSVDIKLSLGYAKKGVALAEKVHDVEWTPKFYEMQGRMHANLGQLDSASLFFDKAMTGYTANGNKRGQGTTYFKIGWVYKRRGQIDKAMEADLNALRLMEELQDQAGIAGALGRVSEDLSRQGRQEEALEYAKRGIAICEKNNLKHELQYALRYAGDACIAMGQNQAALEYYDKAVAAAKSVNVDNTGIADIVNCRGNALKRLGRYEEALKEYQWVLSLSQGANYPSGISTAMANLGEVNLLMGNYKDALPYQLETIRQMQEQADMANLTENYGHVSTIYEKLGDYREALLYRKKAFVLLDSLKSAESDQAISVLRTEYETEKKEATISMQESKLNLQKTMQWIYMGVAAMLGLFAFSFYRNSRVRKKTNELLAAKNAENELLLKEIHHRVKNNLEVVSSLLALQSAQIDDPGIKDAMLEGQNRVQSIGIVHQKLYQGTNLGAVEMKDYFINLSENILDSFGAENRVTIECAMQNLELDIDTAVPLGLIANEILTNAIKYAFPDGREGQIEIKLEQKGEKEYQLTIADNGVGKSGAVSGTGFGTQLISLLTRQLSGSMWEEIKGGTAVYLHFSVKNMAG